MFSSVGCDGSVVGGAWESWWVGRGELWWCSGGLWVVGFVWLLLCVCFFGCGSGVVFVASLCVRFFFFWWFLLVGLVVFFNGFASWHGGCGGGCWPVSGGINGT